MSLLLRILLPCLAMGAIPAISQDPIRLAFPVDCTLGEDCFLQQFVDRDAGPGFRAFDCGPQSYDGHTGTDIRVADLAAMERGAPVLAAAPGAVRATRDGVPDTGADGAPDGQGCGNGVAITHPGGWETQYCHLLQGSVRVTPGEQVEPGQVLGLIGLSGNTDFPHLEFILRRDGETLDPFAAGPMDQCGVSTPQFWIEPITPSGGAIMRAGFADEVPTFDAIRAGTAAPGSLGSDGEALVFWAYLHGGRAGDVLRLSISNVRDEVFHSHDITLDRTQAELFRASGRATPSEGWPPGLYTGTAELYRDGALLGRYQASVRVE